MTQDFHGSVGQVAGGDIVNNGEDMLWHCSTEELIAERQRCRCRLSEARRNVYFSLPVKLLMLGIFCAVVLLNVGLLFKPEYSLLLWGLLGGGLVLPMWLLNGVRGKEGPVIAFYLQRLGIIDLILRDRG